MAASRPVAEAMAAAALIATRFDVLAALAVTVTGGARVPGWRFRRLFPGRDGGRRVPRGAGASHQAVDRLLVVVALVVLARSADVFVVGAAWPALTMGLWPIVVGAVVIGFSCLTRCSWKPAYR